jgi:Leucine-rich repeat (LRR) protein
MTNQDELSLEEKYARLQQEHKRLQDKEVLLQVLLQNDAVKEAVTSLDLSKKELTQLPPEIGQLTNLIWLELWDNQLNNDLPAEIGRLTNLTELYRFIYVNKF